MGYVLFIKVASILYTYAGQYPVCTSFGCSNAENIKVTVLIQVRIWFKFYLIIFWQSDDENDCLNSVKTVEPLFALRTLAPHIDHIDTHSSDKNNCFETYLSLFKLFLQIIQKGCSKRKITYKISEWFIMLANSTNSQWPNNRERVGTSKIRTSKVQKEHRKSKKIEKDQDVESQIRLSTFWSFLTP